MIFFGIGSPNPGYKQPENWEKLMSVIHGKKSGIVRALNTSGNATAVAYFLQATSAAALIFGWHGIDLLGPSGKQLCLLLFKQTAKPELKLEEVVTVVTDLLSAISARRELISEQVNVILAGALSEETSFSGITAEEYSGFFTDLELEEAGKMVKNEEEQQDGCLLPAAEVTNKGGEEMDAKIGSLLEVEEATSSKPPSCKELLAMASELRRKLYNVENSGMKGEEEKSFLASKITVSLFQQLFQTAGVFLGERTVFDVLPDGENGNVTVPVITSAIIR